MGGVDIGTSGSCSWHRSGIGGAGREASSTHKGSERGSVSGDDHGIQWHAQHNLDSTETGILFLVRTSKECIDTIWHWYINAYDTGILMVMTLVY